jgi:hypothetical protein
MGSDPPEAICSGNWGASGILGDATYDDRR